MTADVIELFPETVPPNDPPIGCAIAMAAACKCGSNIALVGAGHGPHAAQLRCRNCDAHRQWLSRVNHQNLRNFIAEIDSHYGAPAEINWTVIKQRREQMATEYDNTNRGVLFKNHDNPDPKHADFSGEGNVGGTDVWINGWAKTSKKGTKFLSLSFKPKKEFGSKKEPAEDFNDAIPW